MLRLNMRSANGSLAAHRIFSCKRLLARSFWGFSRSPDNTSGNKESSPSKYSKLLDFVDGDVADEQQNPHLYHQELARSFKNTPIFTAAVEKFVYSALPPGEHTSELVSQYGLIGSRQDPGSATASREDNLIIGNVNMPWSTFICGSQGAGKSHTLCCLLENALVADNNAGALPNPLAGMVFHYDSYANHHTAQLCEAAYLCSSGIPVTVLVSPSNIWAMKRLYNNLPGLTPGGPRPKIVPLYLDEDQLDISRILKLMAVDPAANSPPLYMEIVMNIVREMAMSGSKFTYTKFLKRLSGIRWLPGQENPLNMRLQLLDSFISPSSETKSDRPAPSSENIWAFEPGSLTIVDLSDPFISSDEACTLFSICLSLFLEQRNKCGQIVAMDEAHKFLTQTGEARVLTNELVSVIRQQRHTGTRVVIATQEPTLSPQLIDLSNVTFVHRFLSPRWYGVLKKHLAGADKQDPGKENTLFRTIVGLRTGQALLFCPTAQMDVDDRSSGTGDARGLMPLEDGYVNIRIRKRLTADGGKSIMATDTFVNPESQPVVDDVPMYIVGGGKKSGVKAEAERNKSNKSATNKSAHSNDQMSVDEELDEEIDEEMDEELDEEMCEELDNEFLELTRGWDDIIARGTKLSVDILREAGFKSLSSQGKKRRSQFYRKLEEEMGFKPGKIGKDGGLKALLTEAVDKHMVRFLALNVPRIVADNVHLTSLLMYQKEMRNNPEVQNAELAAKEVKREAKEAKKAAKREVRRLARLAKEANKASEKAKKKASEKAKKANKSNKGQKGEVCEMVDDISDNAVEAAEKENDEKSREEQEENEINDEKEIEEKQIEKEEIEGEKEKESEGEESKVEESKIEEETQEEENREGTREEENREGTREESKDEVIQDEESKIEEENKVEEESKKEENEIEKDETETVKQEEPPTAAEEQEEKEKENKA
ncbi:hypothetical protein AAE478_010030 [Parahypoxylon ruwenzoriense]